MTIRTLTQRWIREQEEATARARIIARTLEEARGDEEVDPVVLLDQALRKYHGEPGSRVASRLASSTTLAVYELLDGEGLEEI